MKTALLIPALFVVGVLWLVTWPFALVNDVMAGWLYWMGDR